MKAKLIINTFTSLSENKLAFLIFLLITIIYLHPMFLGKVDTPIDIRDVHMYPWREHTVKEKIKTQIVADVNLKSAEILDKKKDQSVYLLEAGPNQNVKYPVDFKFKGKNELNFKDLKNSNYYITADFYIMEKEPINAYFSFYLVEKLTWHSEPLKVARVSEIKGKQNAYTVYWELNYVLKKIKPNFEESYILIINKGNKKVTFYFSTPILKLEDYSNIQTVHCPVTDDIIKWFTPAREYYSNSLKQFKLPFWTNDVLTGIEFLAEPQVGFFHPVYFLTYFLLDHFTAHSIIIFLSLFLCGIGAYIFAKYIGLHFLAAVFTGIVYMFHPCNVTWFSFEHMLMCSALLPFILLTYCKNLQSPNLLNGYLLTSALLMGLLFLSGHLQYVYYCLIFFSIFIVFILLIKLSHKKSILKHIFSILFIFIAGIMIGLVVLVPFFSLLEDSHRLVLSKSAIKQSAVSIPALISLVHPFYRGYPSWDHFQRLTLGWSIFLNYTYFGIIPLLLSLLSLGYIKRYKIIIFFLVCILFSILVSTASPFFFLIKDYIPGFSKLLSGRFLQLYSLSVPFLAGIGFDCFLNNFFVNNKFKKIIITCALLITSVDLMYHASYFITWSNPKNYKKVHENGTLEFLMKKFENSSEPFRVLALTKTRLPGKNLEVNVAHPNTLQPYGLEDASGYSSFLPKDVYNLFVYSIKQDPSLLFSNEYLRLFDNPNIPYPIYSYESKILDLLNIKYFLAPNFFEVEDSKNLRKIFKSDATIYENLDYLPRAYVVPNHEVIEDPKETIIKLDSKEFDPQKTVILMSHYDIRIQGSELRNSALISSSIEFVNYEPENIQLKVQTDKPGFLVLGHNLNQNWNACVNGKRAKLLKANLIQRAVYLPEAGEYKVECYYTPSLFLLYEGITILTLFILFSLVMVVCKRNSDRPNIQNKQNQQSKTSNRKPY